MDELHALITSTLESVFIQGRISTKYKDGWYKNDAVEVATAIIMAHIPEEPPYMLNLPSLQPDELEAPRTMIEVVQL